MNDIIEQRLETAKRRAVGQRNYRRARDRALAKLANKYPEAYQELLSEERLIDEQTGKAWSDIAGSHSKWVTPKDSEQ